MKSFEILAARGLRAFLLTSLVFGTLAAVPTPAEAKRRVRIKLATLAPKGSKWLDSIERMRRRWAEVSSGAVQLKVYPGGVVGEETDMVTKMRIGQLQAATITNIGLGSIDRSMVALQIPMLFRSYAELDYVRDELGDDLAAKLADKGFVLLEWGDAGWVHFFSKRKAVTPKEMTELKLYVWAGDPHAEAAWRQAGFDVVPTANSDVLQGLQTGRLEAFANVPLYALATQWFAAAPHMTKVKWAPLSGATVVTKKAWEKIDPDLRPKLKAIAKEESRSSRAEIRSLGDKAIQAMVDRGLTVHDPTPEQVEQWRATARSADSAIRGRIVPEETFAEVERLLKAFRAGRGKPNP